MPWLIVAIAPCVHYAEWLVVLDQSIFIDLSAELEGKRKKGGGRWLAADDGVCVVGHYGTVSRYEW